MCIDFVVHFSFWREIVLIGLFGNAGFERTFDCIPGEIIGPVVKTAIHQVLCFLNPQFCEFLKIRAIHGR